MPHFHETGWGRIFFDGQLPRIVTALETIAQKLPTREPSVDRVARAIHNRLCTGKPFVPWEDIRDDDHRETHRETARAAIAALQEST